MSDALKNVLTEEEEKKLAENGVKILAEDELELAGGGEADYNHSCGSSSMPIHCCNIWPEV